MRIKLLCTANKRSAAARPPVTTAQSHQASTCDRQAASSARLRFDFSFTCFPDEYRIWRVINISILMRVARSNSKQASISIEGHRCYACWILCDLIQPLLVFTIPDIDDAITSCTVLPVLGWTSHMYGRTFSWVWQDADTFITKSLQSRYRCW